MNQAKKIQALATVPNKVREAVRRHAQEHVEAQCNGAYYWDEDEDGREFWSSEEGREADERVREEIARLFGGEIPDFVSYRNDPRGVVVKIETEKLDDEAREMCRACNLAMDMGGDYTITENKGV